MKFAIYKGVTVLGIEIQDCNENSIVYQVTGVPICCYDQHSRARIGVKFYDYKVSEDPQYVFYSKLFDAITSGQFDLGKIKDVLERLEIIRDRQLFQTPYNLMSRMCSYKVNQTYDSLKGQMARRLKLCEEEFIVSLHWLLRHHMLQIDTIKNIASNFLPGCDVLQKCDYSSVETLSQMFGCLFAGCGRWKDEAQYASFNQSCTTYEIMEEQLGIVIPRSKYEIENDYIQNYESSQQ